jgi:tetratricopeptide (TPR) repeat protein
MKTVALVVTLAIAPLARAAPADALLESGLRSYAVGRYDEAIDAFQRGFKLDGRADFLYALGQAQRMKGDCKAAAASYRAYLRTAPPERAAAPARQNLERCERELANAPPPQPPAASVTLAQPALPVAAPARRVRDDRAAAALAALGAAALLGGGVSWGLGESGARDLAGASSYAQFASRASDADAYDRERIGGIVAVAVGGALVVSAAARWIWLARHR